jgi:dipeptidyl aminopeptidase/acylaminoacyl peptidase
MSVRWVRMVALGLWFLAGACAGQPFTVDLMLRDESLGQILIDPPERWAVIERRDRYETGDDFRYGGFTDRLLSKLLVADLATGSMVGPLIVQDQHSGYWAGGFSPSGDRLAIFRLSAGRLHAGIVEMGSRAVRWLALAPDQPTAAPQPIWIDDHRLLIVAMPDEQLPDYLAQPGFAQHSAVAGWARTEAGRDPAVSVLTSSPSAPLGIAKRLLLVDTTSGRETRLFGGDIADVALSSDHTYVALAILGHGIQPDPATRVEPAYQTRARRLVVVNLATGIAIDACPDKDLLPNLLAWAPHSNHLLVFARRLGEPWAAGQLLVAGVSGSMPQPVAMHGVTPIVDRVQETSLVVHAGWMGEDPLVYASAGTRRDWYVFEPHRPAVALTHTLSEAPPNLLMANDRQLMLLDNGIIQRVDRHGQVKTMLERVAGVGSTLLDPYQLGPRRLFNDIPRTLPVITIAPPASDVPARSLAGRTVTLPADAVLVGHAPRMGVSFVLRRHDSGYAVLSMRTTAGAERALLAINQHLANVDRSQAFPIAARAADGTNLVHWLLLPRSTGRPPPLIVLPYPGLRFSAAQSPVASPGAVMTAVNGELLAAHGYAVLYPSLPIDYDQHEPLAAINAAIDGAVADTVATGLVDGARVALWGHSYGGYAVLCAAASGTAFRAVIASAAISDLSAGYASLDPQTDRERRGMALLGPIAWYEQGQGRMGASLWAEPERYRRNSPLMRAPDIRAPLLLIHGDVDFIPVSQAERMFTALYRLGRDVELLRYAGEGHLLASPANIRDQWQRLFAWLDAHLRKAAPP